MGQCSYYDDHNIQAILSASFRSYSWHQCQAQAAYSVHPTDDGRTPTIIVLVVHISTVTIRADER